jgi:hypothetical protein
LSVSLAQLSLIQINALARNPAGMPAFGAGPPNRRAATGEFSFMDAIEKDYYLERAEAELDLANAAAHEKTARAHYYLAGFYLDRAYCGVANEN